VNATPEPEKVATTLEARNAQKKSALKTKVVQPEP